jgi:hypothetical protein
MPHQPDIPDAHGRDIRCLELIDTAGAKGDAETGITFERRPALTDKPVVDVEQHLPVFRGKMDGYLVPLGIQAGRIDPEAARQRFSYDKIEIPELLIIDEVYILMVGRDDAEDIPEVGLHTRGKKEIEG